MIKNDAQLKQAMDRQALLRKEMETLREQHGEDAPQYLLTQLEDDERKAEAEIVEYNNLKSIPLDAAISLLARQPVAIENIGELLAKLRIAAKVTQAQLAQRLNWEQPNISRFESPNYNGQTIGKISEYLDGLGIWLHVTPSLENRPSRIRFVPSSGMRNIQFELGKEHYFGSAVFALEPATIRLNKVDQTNAAEQAQPTTTVFGSHLTNIEEDFWSFLTYHLVGTEAQHHESTEDLVGT